MLTADQVEAFYEIGFFVIRGLFTRAEIGEMSAGFDELRRQARELDGNVVHNGANFVVENTVGDDGSKQQHIRRVSWCGGAVPVLLRYGGDPRLLRLASELLGCKEMNQLINQAHFKDPGDTIQFPLHQDSTHRGYGTEAWTDVNGRGSYVQTATLIDPMTRENGPLLFCPGSCHDGHLALKYSDEIWPDHPAADPEKAAIITGDPGDVAVFGPYTLHGSHPNLSSVSRRVFINGYAHVGANHRQYPGNGAGRLLRVE